MKEIWACGAKKQSDLTLEWDKLAEERHRQIVSGDDLSFKYVVVPTMFRLLEGIDPTLVLDIGSGTGEFTAQLARIAKNVIGIEPSQTSVAIARISCSGLRNIRFIEAPLEEAVSSLPNQSATAATACMTLMSTPNLAAFAKALGILLQNGGKFVAVFTHPWFWPRYWGYETEPWFSYGKEIFVEAPFVISRRRTEVRTTHVHRPLEEYVTIFAQAGFQLEALVEPMPSPETMSLYPRTWEFPRFISMRWSKVDQ